MAADGTTQERLDRIDGRICHCRSLYLKATWAGHEGEADEYEYEVDRLLDLRTVVQAGLLTPMQQLEVDAL